MKTATITFHNTNNFGAALQCYALQQSLLALGVENEVLDYTSPYLNKPYKLSALREKGGGRYFLGMAYSLLRMPRNKAFRKFRRLLILSKPLNKDTIKTIENEYDLFITGSDQVWNGSLVGYDDSYFLYFVKDRDKKGSYAASFGFLNIEEELKPKYRELLQNYKYYNVRETSGLGILKDLFGVDANVTVDPTLLIDKDSWSRVANNVGINEPYILVYQISPSGKLIEVVKQLTKQTGLKIVAVPFIMGCYFDYIPKPTLGPSEWVGLFQNASYVVTDSFHGTAFSMIFNRNVWCCIPENDSRISSFLSIVGIPERLIYPSTTIPKNLTEVIPFGQINIKLGEIREQGLAALRTMVYENK